MSRSASTAESYQHLRRASAARKATTLARLEAGLAQLAEQGRAVSLETIREVTKLHPRTITRNPDAAALFRAHSTSMRVDRARHQSPPKRAAAKPAPKGGPPALPPAVPSARDPLESYSKTRLIRRIRRLEAELAGRAERDAQHLALLQEHMRCALIIERLEGEVHELATYRAMLGQLRDKLREQEHGKGT